MYSKKNQRISRKGTGQHILSNNQLKQLLQQEGFISGDGHSDFKFKDNSEELGEGSCVSHKEEVERKD